MSVPFREPRNLVRLCLCVAVGLMLWFAPPPTGLEVQPWRVFGVFVATILAFLVRPLPMGPCVLLALLVLATTGTLAPQSPTSVTIPLSVWDAVDDIGTPDDNADQRIVVTDDGSVFRYDVSPHSRQERLRRSFAATLRGFGDTTVWLVVAAFLISGAVVETGLGRRLALVLVHRLGRTTLGLGYAITGAEVLLGPFIPSNTARGGGLMAPIVRSLCHALGSEPVTSSRRAGQFLVFCGAHANLIAAAMFLTGMAANPLVSRIASDVLQVEFGWGRWFVGAIVPGLVSAAVVPWLLFCVARPEITDATAARREAREQLTTMGPWSPRQVAMALVLLVMLVLWATGAVQTHLFGASLPAALVALVGVATLIVIGVLPWRSIIGNAAAWDALLWLGGLVTMADALRETGFVDWFAEQMGTGVAGLPAISAVIALALVYFYSMYAFSMLTGHILALAGVFMAVAAGAGAPPLLTVALLAYFSNLCGCTTHYSTGPLIIYFGLGYVTVPRWWAIGFVVSLAHLGVWLGVGLPYWKLLGWW